MANVGPIGCIPNQRDTNPTAGDSCVTFPNQLAQLFNIQLKGLIAELSSNLAGSLFVYADVNHILEDILQNYAAFGMCLGWQLYNIRIFPYTTNSIGTRLVCLRYLAFRLDPEDLRLSTGPRIESSKSKILTMEGEEMSCDLS